MTTLFTARRRAEEFATAVDTGERPDGREHAEVARLVGLVTALRDQPDIAPRPEFTADLRDRLLIEAATVLTPENAGLALPTRARGARERRLVAAASAVVLIGGTAGMAAAAQDALPGEALYPVKRGIERAEAGLSMSDAGKGRDLLGQATDRLQEVERLVDKDSTPGAPQVPETLDAFSAQAAQGANLLLTSFEDDRDPSSVRAVRTFAADNVAQLTALADDVPEQAQDELAAAAVTLRDLDAQAAAICSTCATGLPAVEVPGLILARNEVDRALDTLTPSALDNSHPVVVPRGAVHKKRTSRPDPVTRPEATAPAPAPAGGATAPEEAPEPTDTKVPALPDLEKPISPGTKTVTKAPGQVVDDLTDGLDGVVETLLPDTDLGGTVDDLLP
ncbi:MAG TPA: DUF5667 domain-containing protein [Nocardioidaceae bacterium]|nr:DUF5667 domain-containing protein [Nocardioidaceae bacterium]